MVFPASIPSPSEPWQALYFGQWLNDIGLTWVSPTLALRSYAICILVGIVLAVLLTRARFRARDTDPGLVIDIAIWAVIPGIIGARLFHVVTHPDDYFGSLAKLVHVFYIWEGGFALFGGLIGGAIGAAIGCHFAGLRFLSVADALAPGLFVALAFGRLGNWFNHELFGQPTDLPWGLQIETTNTAYPVGLPADTLFQPTFLYELILDVIGIVVVIALERRFRLQWGTVIGVYLIWYGIARALVESIRIDPSVVVLGIRINVLVAIAAAIVGIVLIAAQSRRHPGIEPSMYLPGREPEPTAGLDSGDVYTDDDDDLNDEDLDNDAELVTASPAGSASSGKPATSALGA